MRKDLVLGQEDRNALSQLFGPQPGFAFQDSSRHPELDLATIVKMLWEQRWLILALSVVGLLLGIGLSLMTTPMYRADVTLEVNPPRVEVIDEKSTSNVTPESWDFIITQANLLSSRSLAERVAQDLNLGNDENFVAQTGSAAERVKAAAGRILGGLKVEMPEEGQLIRFNYVSDDPQRAAQVANGIADGFIKSGLERRYDASTYARKFLEQQIAKTRADLEGTERAQVAYAQSQGIINTATGGADGPSGDVNSLQGASLVALNTALADATAKRVAAEGAYRQAQIAGSADATQSTAAMRQARGALEAEYQEKRTLLKPEHPDMLSLRSRIEELDRQISSERSQAAGGRAATLLAEYRAASAAESALRSRVAALKGSVLDLRGRSVQYNILQREVDTNRGLYDALLQRYKEIGVAAGVGASPVSIVDRADVPGGPYKPNLFFNTIAGLGLGLLAGIAAAIGLEMLNDTIKTREDVRKKLNTACLGVVPRRRGKGGIVADLKDVSSPISEAYSAVIAALRFSTERGAPKAMLMTSAGPSEGKSSSTFALAQNYSRRGERVLIIDGDMRRPAFRSASTRHGLTKLLTDEQPLAAHVVESQFENLWLLPCGPTPPNPADLLSSGRFKEILAEASENFDRVIIDGPPALGLADASFLSAAVGEVIIAIESGKTRTRAAREAMERVEHAGAHVLGVILTKSDVEATGYDYRLFPYGYKSVAGKTDEIVLIGHQAEPEDA